MALEFALAEHAGADSYPFRLDADVLDWAPVVEGVLHAIAAGAGPDRIAVRCHNALADMILAVAVRTDERVIVLGGGCFQNAALLERSVRRLRDAGFTVHWPQQVLPNDGGLALGQVLAAARERYP